MVSVQVTTQKEAGPGLPTTAPRRWRVHRQTAGLFEPGAQSAPLTSNRRSQRRRAKTDSKTTAGDKDNTAAARPGHSTAGRGFREAGPATTYSIPFLQILQALSPQLQENDKHRQAGYTNTGDRRSLGRQEGHCLRPGDHPARAVVEAPRCGGGATGIPESTATRRTAKAASSSTAAAAPPDGNEPIGTLHHRGRHAQQRQRLGSGRAFGSTKIKKYKGRGYKAKTIQDSGTVAASRLRSRPPLPPRADRRQGPFFNRTPSPSTARERPRLASCPMTRCSSPPTSNRRSAGQGPRRPSPAPAAATRSPGAGGGSQPDTREDQPGRPAPSACLQGPSRAPLLIRNGERSSRSTPTADRANQDRQRQDPGQALPSSSPGTPEPAGHPAKHLAATVKGPGTFAAYTGKAAHVLTKSGATNGELPFAASSTRPRTSRSSARELQAERARLLTRKPVPETLTGEVDPAIKAEQINLARPTFQLNAESPRLEGRARQANSSAVRAGGGEGLTSAPVLTRAIPDSSRPAAPLLQDKPDVLAEIHRQAQDNPMTGPPRRSARAACSAPGDYGASRVIPMAATTRRTPGHGTVHRPAPDPAGTPRESRATTSRELLGRTRPPRKATAKAPHDHEGRACSTASRKVRRDTIFNSDSIKDIEGEDGAKVEVSAHPHYFHGNKPKSGSGRRGGVRQGRCAHRPQVAGLPKEQRPATPDGVREGAGRKGLYTAITRAAERIDLVHRLAQEQEQQHDRKPSTLRGDSPTGPQVPYSQNYTPRSTAAAASPSARPRTGSPRP